MKQRCEGCNVDKHKCSDHGVYICPKCEGHCPQCMKSWSVYDEATDALWERACDIIAEMRPELDENDDEFDALAQAELAKIELQAAEPQAMTQGRLFA